MPDMTPEELEARLDAYLIDCHKKIAEYGWMVQGVFGTDADPGCFSYSVGLTDTEHPELFVDSLAPNQAGGMINAVARLVRDGALDPRLGGTFDADYSCPFMWHGPIDLRVAEMNMTTSFYLTATAYQILWPDTAGKFPGEDGYDSDRFPQRVMPLA